MEGEASTQVSARAGRRCDGKRRIWSFLEEAELIKSVRATVTKGWKSENGFRPGYLGIVEEEFRRAYPNTDIRAEPHINSKLHSWRRQYASLTTMLNTSGFGWDDVAKMIIVDDDTVWDSHVKRDPGIKGMRFKRWPHYPDWVELFGRDRATGERADDGLALDEEDVLPPAATQPTPGTDRESNMGGGFEDEFDVQSENNFNGPPLPHRRSGNKRQRAALIRENPVIDAIGSFAEKTESRLDSVATKMGAAHEIRQARLILFEELSKIEGLSLRDRIYVGRLLTTSPAELEFFITLPLDGKAEFVGQMLETARV